MSENLDKTETGQAEADRLRDEIVRRMASTKPRNRDDENREPHTDKPSIKKNVAK